MKTYTACSRDHLLQKLEDMNFYGPLSVYGNEFMIYHGQALAIPHQESFTVAQFRFLLQEVDKIISQAEWKT